MVEKMQPVETQKQRVDRELIELLNELRVALPGVQILFGFLLTVPFAQRFGQISNAQRLAYLGTLLLLTLASLLFIAPAAQHRVLFRQHDKEGLLLRSSRYARAATVVLLAALCLGLYFIIEMVYPGPTAIVSSLAALAVGTWLWIAVPHALVRPIERRPARDAADDAG
ncbi:MAG: hypothetical protein QOK14_1288 [Frankiaceae bacterium]|nr:hypothetical protein [Frankiaceae bacterium]